jgi:aminoglycoside 6'-N-acetyltransferase I
MRIVQANSAHLDQWAHLRAALWDWMSVEEHRADAAETYCSGKEDKVAFVALTDAGDLTGFAEASLRNDYVNGCETSPVAFLEGIIVAPEHRTTGIARALVDRVADWGRAHRCSEFASDALLGNVDSHRFHEAIGFEEAERVVCFRRDL